MGLVETRGDEGRGTYELSLNPNCSSTVRRHRRHYLSAMNFNSYYSCSCMCGGELLVCMSVSVYGYGKIFRALDEI